MQNCDIKISFVLDVGYTPDDLSYYQYKSNPYDEFHTQRVLDFPFTWTFLVMLCMIKDINNIYII